MKNRLEELRKQRGIKQEDLANALEVSRQDVNTVCCVDISALKFVRRSCSTVAYKAHLLPYVATYPLFRA